MKNYKGSFRDFVEKAGIEEVLDYLEEEEIEAMVVDERGLWSSGEYELEVMFLYGWNVNSYSLIRGRTTILEYSIDGV